MGHYCYNCVGIVEVIEMRSMLFPVWRALDVYLTSIVNHLRFPQIYYEAARFCDPDL